jgi:hypothetical protein
VGSVAARSDSDPQADSNDKVSCSRWNSKNVFFTVKEMSEALVNCLMALADGSGKLATHFKTLSHYS